MIIFKYPFYILFSIWNPFRRYIKPRWPNGKPVLDIGSRLLDREITRRETDRRVKNNEEVTQCFRIGLRNSVSMSGKSM